MPIVMLFVLSGPFFSLANPIDGPWHVQALVGAVFGALGMPAFRLMQDYYFNGHPLRVAVAAVPRSLLAGAVLGAVVALLVGRF